MRRTNLETGARRYAQRDMADPDCTALGYDAKIKMVTDHGLAVMPFCTMKPVLPRFPNSDLPAHGCKIRHMTQLNYVGVPNTEVAEVITAMTTTIKDGLKCQRCIAAMLAGQPPVHDVVIDWCEDTQGFRLSWPECAQCERDGLWQYECIDAAAPYLKSIFHRRENSGDPDWTDLLAIICRSG